MKTIKLILWAIATWVFTATVLKLAILAALSALSLLVYAGWPSWVYFFALAVYVVMWVWIDTWHRDYPTYMDLWYADNRYLWDRGRVIRGTGWTVIVVFVIGELFMAFGG